MSSKVKWRPLFIVSLLTTPFSWSSGAAIRAFLMIGEVMVDEEDDVLMSSSWAPPRLKPSLAATVEEVRLLGLVKGSVLARLSVTGMGYSTTPGPARLIGVKKKKKWDDFRIGWGGGGKKRWWWIKERKSQGFEEDHNTTRTTAAAKFFVLFLFELQSNA